MNNVKNYIIKCINMLLLDNILNTVHHLIKIVFLLETKQTLETK